MKGLFILTMEGERRKAKTCREQALRNRRLGREEKAAALDVMADRHEAVAKEMSLYVEE